jgi:hypothetical protein
VSTCTPRGEGRGEHKQTMWRMAWGAPVHYEEDGTPPARARRSRRGPAGPGCPPRRGRAGPPAAPSAAAPGPVERPPLPRRNSELGLTRAGRAAAEGRRRRPRRPPPRAARREMKSRATCVRVYCSGECSGAARRGVRETTGPNSSRAGTHATWQQVGRHLLSSTCDGSVERHSRTRVWRPQEPSRRAVHCNDIAPPFAAAGEARHGGGERGERRPKSDASTPAPSQHRQSFQSRRKTAPNASCISETWISSSRLRM